MPAEELTGGITSSVLDVPKPETEQRESTTEDYWNTLSSPAIVFNNPDLSWRGSMSNNNLDINNPTFKSLYSQMDGEGKAALGRATSLEHAIAIAGRREVFADSSRAIEQDPFLIQLGMGAIPSMVNVSSALPIGYLGAMAKLGKQAHRINNVAVGAAFGGVAGAGMNTIDETLFEAQGIQHDYLTAAFGGLALGTPLGAFGGMLAGPQSKAAAHAMSKEGDTFTQDFSVDKDITIEIVDGVPKITGLGNVGQMSKFGMDWIPGLGKLLRSDVHTVYQGDSSILRGEMTKWSNATISLHDSNGNVVPNAWNAQNEKAIVNGMHNTVKAEVKGIYTSAKETGYTGSYDDFIVDVSRSYTNAAAAQEKIVYSKINTAKQGVVEGIKVEKQQKLEEFNQPEAWYRASDNKQYPLTEDLIGTIADEHIFFRNKNKKELAQFKQELDVEYKEKLDIEVNKLRDEIYSNHKGEFKGSPEAIKAAKMYQTYYNSVLKAGQEAKLGELQGMSGDRLYRPRTWNFEGVKDGDISEIDAKKLLYAGLSNHPNQATYTAPQLQTAVDNIYKQLLSRGFDLENLTTTFVIPKELPFEGMLKSRQWRLDEGQLGGLLKDNLEDVTGAYNYKMSGRVAMGKVTDGTEWGEYISNLKEKMIESGEYSNTHFDAFARTIEDTVGTLRMQQNSNSPEWTWTRNMMTANSVRLGGGFGGNQFIELAANAAMLGVRSLVNGRFAASWKGAGEMLYKGKMPDDQFTRSVIASGHMDAALHTHRVNRYSDAEQGLNPGFFEKKLHGMQDWMMKVNGMRYFTAVMEDFTGGSIMTQIGDLASKGKLSNKEITRLARWGMSPEDAKGFAKDMDMYYKPAEGKLELDRFSEYNQNKFQQAIQNGIDEMVVQGDSIHAPNWMKAPKPALKLLTQFMRFPLIAQESLLRRGLTEEQGRFVGGVIASTMTYMGLKYTREQASIAMGLTDPMDAKYDYFGPWGEEAMERGVYGSFNYNANLGFMSSLWNYGAIATGNSELGRDYAFDKGITALGGPTGSAIDDFVKLTTSAANGELGTDKDLMILKGGTPFLSLPIISEGFSSMIKE